jgi:hypothetical protein
MALSHRGELGRKPMAAVRRVSLFEREVRFKLSTAALDILFDCAHVLTEGQRQGKGWFGSTMITIDLGRAAAAVRDECDAATARRVAELFAGDPRVKARCRELAAAEAAERAGRLGRLDVDMRVRASGARVQIDLDVEGEVAAAGRSVQ